MFTNYTFFGKYSYFFIQILTSIDIFKATGSECESIPGDPEDLPMIPVLIHSSTKMRKMDSKVHSPPLSQVHP
jgi:hypothetical protein